MRFVIYWLITCIVFTVFFFMNNAHAEQREWYEYQTETFRIVLVNKDCTDNKGRVIGLMALREFKEEVAYGCWNWVAGKIHILWDATGKVSAIPSELFVRKVGP